LPAWRGWRGLEAKGTKVCPRVLYARVAYSHAVIDGRTALEFEPEMVKRLKR